MSYVKHDQHNQNTDVPDGYVRMPAQGGIYDEIVPATAENRWESEAPECDVPHLPGYDRRACPKCQRRVRAVQRRLDQEEMAEQLEALAGRWLSADEALDVPDAPAIWGDEESPYSSEGQAWMIAGADGTGKTSLACQYVKARLGLPTWEMWGLPVRTLERDASVIYVAMDRPVQIRQALARGMDDLSKKAIRGRFHMWTGPTPHLLSTLEGQEWMLARVQDRHAGLVVFDSRKDLGDVLDNRAVSGIARCIALLVSEGIEVLILHHTNKGGGISLESIQGFREVFSGLGSVLILEGKPGGDEITVHHAKPIKRPHEALRVRHDHATGRSVVVALPEGVADVRLDLQKGADDEGVRRLSEELVEELNRQRYSDPSQRYASALAGKGRYGQDRGRALKWLQEQGLADWRRAGRGGRAKEWYLTEWEEEN